MVFLMRRRRVKSTVEPEQPAVPAAPVETLVVEPSAAVEPEELELGDDTPTAKRKIVVSKDPRKEEMAQIARDYHDAMVQIIRQWLRDDAHKQRAATASEGASGAPPNS
jgi:hypothetical protein